MHFGDSVEVLAAGVAIVAAISGGLGSLFSHWLDRRKASGRIGTSEAAVLWQQSQDMRHAAEERLVRTEEQRDRLIAGYTEQILPLLTSINTTLRVQSETTERRGSSRGVELSPPQGGGYALAEPDAAPPST